MDRGIWSLPITEARSADVRGDGAARPLAVFALDTAGAIYGTIILMAVIAGTAADPGHGKALSLTVATLSVFWLAHAHAQTLSHHLKGAKRLEWPAVKAAMVEERPLLEGPLPMLVVLVLGELHVLQGRTAVRLALGIGGYELVTWGDPVCARQRWSWSMSTTAAWSTASSGWRSCSSRWSCTDRGHGCPAAVSTAGWPAGAPGTR